MFEEVLVKLVYDPFCIYAGEGCRVTGLADEIKAFHTIGNLLRQASDPVTRKPRIYILDRNSWKHFRSLLSVRGVLTTEYTPRRQAESAIGAELPDWLTDETVVGWKLLQRPVPQVKDDWVATLSEWLFPGISDATTMQAWLVAAATSNEVPEPLTFPHVVEWLCERFRQLSSQAIRSTEVVADLTEQLREKASPCSFAKGLIRRCAILPLVRPGIDRALRVPGIVSDSAQDIARANKVPLLFPLPDPMHTEVSRLMSRAVRTAQLERPETFEQVATTLNALWGGVSDELDRWLQVNPRGMSEAAARHLSNLPGFATDETAKRLVELFSPPPTVAHWTNLDDSFDHWVNDYANYIERMFYRRTLPTQGEDPAEPFAKWVKANPTVFFNHPDKGYFCVAGLVQRALQAGRPVILVLVDALAIHVAGDALAAFTAELGDQPTSIRYSFSPVPTITEVCKEAILGGILPEECSGNLSQTILRRYELTKEQLQLASHWQDAERVRVTNGVRLLVYRDNRLDENLSTFTSYRALRESFSPTITSIAKLVGQWVNEFRHWNDSLPLVLLTGDHGFTFGPKIDFASGRTNASHRCVALGEGRPEDSELRDGSLTFLDRETFHLRGGYLVARGRVTGSGTMSGWTLSHGGLLPEEVIVPVIEWYGDQQASLFPDITVPGGALRDNGKWVFTLQLKNNNPVQTNGGRIRVTIAGEGTGPSKQYPPLNLGTSANISLEVPGEDLLTSPEIVFEVTFSPRATGGPVNDLIRHVSVARARQFIERTKDQAAFEDMF